ncbi:MAG: hypothetical protein J6M61_01685 [Bacteroidales bacterium]|nr:hypothetical protein [Bacteroidales bacterium]
MFKRFFIAILSLVVFSIAVFAQRVYPFWYQVPEGVTITIKPKSQVYVAPAWVKGAVESKREPLFASRMVTEPFTYKSKKVSKETVVEVYGYVRTAQEFPFNGYIISYKGDMFLALPESVVDNSLLDAKNLQLEQIYSQMLDSLDNMNARLNDMLSLKSTEIDNALATLDAKEARKEAIVDSLYEVKLASVLGPMQEQYDAWYSTLTPSAAKAAKHISVYESYLGSPNSAGGCDYNFAFVNRSNKTIKYVYWYGNVYNAVGDKVACDIRDNYSFSGKDTGPYKPGEIGGGTWDCIIYNWSAKKLKLTSIKVIYTDGTSVTISGKDAEGITGAPKAALFDFDYRFYKSGAKSEFERQINADRKLWNDRKKYMGSWETLPYTDKAVKDYYSAASVLHSEITNYAEVVAVFEKENFITIK